MIIKEVSPEWFTAHIADLVIDALIHQDPRERAQQFTNIMDTARSLDLAEQAEEAAQAIAQREGEPELWELPESFEKPVELQPFPLSALPPVLSEYLSEVSKAVQVYPEMCVLPMLSTLSLCVMGKACIHISNRGHSEPLNLYTITVASPGERKSSSFHKFIEPLESYVKRYNAIHSVDIQNNKAERAVIEKQRQKAINSKNPDIEKIKELSAQLNDMEELHELKLNVKDVTPEALAWEMHLQNERIGILDDEGSVFDVLSGLYSNGQANINIFLEAYDGSQYTILRRTREDITLNNPLLAIGLMTQPSHFDDAMSNRQFSGRGFIPRFLFSFPGSKAGYQKISNGDISDRASNNYIGLVNKLLKMPYPVDTVPLISCSSEAEQLLGEYFQHLQDAMRPGGIFENIKEWASKQFARCIKIAGILHLCEHGAAEELSENTAMCAISIAMWTENHALKALSGEMSDPQEVKDAKYILNRVKEKQIKELTKRELLRLCRKLSVEEFEKPLDLLEDMKCIKRKKVYRSKGGNPKENIKFNPLIF